MIMVLGILSAFPVMAVNTTELQAEKIVVGLGIVQIPTEYSSDEYYVVYEMGGEENHAYICEKTTDIIVEEYAEVISEANGKTRDTVGGYQTVDVYDYFYASNTNDQTTKLRAVVNMKVYTETIASQRVRTIISINGCTTQLVGSGPCYLETASTTLNSNTSTYCDVNCTGVLKAESTTSISAGITANYLDSIGFEINYTTSMVWVARLAYSKVVRVTV